MTNLLYFDAFSGLSGDMTLGALLHLGLPLEHLQNELAKLGLTGYRLEAKPAVQQYIAGIKLEVSLDKHEHTHRGVNEIHQIIDNSQLADRVKERSKKIFWNLAQAEGKIHEIGPNEVHFHEVGALDALVDIVGACIGFEFFQIDEFYCSPLPMGSGFVRAAHGLLPVPAPATLELLAQAGATLKPAVTLSEGVEYPARGEMVTPTGAAIVATLCRWEQPACSLKKIGYGLGSKEFAWPNTLRLWLGSRNRQLQPVHTHENSAAQGYSHEAETVQHAHELQELQQHSHPHHIHEHQHTEDLHKSIQEQATAEQESLAKLTKTSSDQYKTPLEVSLLETNLDDMTPEGLGFLMEKLMGLEALDVFFTPIQMKKNRPAIKLSVLARPADEKKLANLLLTESSAFGVRISHLQRYIAEREFRQVQIGDGIAQLKLKILEGKVIEAVPEYESVAALARQTGRSWRQMYDEVKQAGLLIH